MRKGRVCGRGEGRGCEEGEEGEGARKGRRGRV